MDGYYFWWLLRVDEHYEWMEMGLAGRLVRRKDHRRDPERIRFGVQLLGRKLRGDLARRLRGGFGRIFWDGGCGVIWDEGCEVLWDVSFGTQVAG